PVQIEAALVPVAQLRGELLPARPELPRPPDDPRDVIRVVSAAQVRARIAEPAKHGHRAGGPLEPGAEPAVLALRLLPHGLEERRGYPAAGRLAPRHSLGGP